MNKPPIALALDTNDLSQACSWTTAVAPYISTVKIGLELFCAEGPGAVEKIQASAGDLDIFIDAKLHDIPATVAGASRSLSRLSPRYVTVHCLGGPAMIAAAAEALPQTLVAAVTILTSHDAVDLQHLGIEGPPDAAVRRLAKMAVAAGARALVCSPREVAMLRETVDRHVTLITPGVRPAGAAAADQVRIATPEAAIADGADLLVIGRPITGAQDPAAAAAAIAASIGRS